MLKMNNIMPAIMISIIAFGNFSCENDLEVINSFSVEGDMAMQTMTNANIIFTDSALLQVKISAPVIQNFPNAEQPYLEFPNGFHIVFFDKNEKPETDLTAKYGIYYNQQALWEARDSVEVINREGEIMNTEQLFWDEKKKLIYSNTFVKITRPDEIIMGEGLEANENFTRWKIKKIQGEIYLKDE
jgi:LPS export ABC transporter protein LptC